MRKNQQTLEAEINTIKRELVRMGSMRPGSLSRQPRARGGEYYQLSYSHRGKGRTEYVRPEYEPVIRKEIETYKRFRELIRQWVDLALDLAKLKQKRAAEEARRSSE
jgi:hypothetical protein